MTDDGRYGTYLELRRKFPVFVYESFACEAVDGGVLLKFRFRAGEDLCFQPRIFLSIPGIGQDLLQEPLIRSMAFHVGMVEMISYWKAFCSPRIRIEPFSLGSSDQQWWKKLFRLGLAEFFHTNGIPQPGEAFMAFEMGENTGNLPEPEVGGPMVEPAGTLPEHEAALFEPGTALSDPPGLPPVMVPVGGGKDSVVTLDMLIHSHFPVRAFVINQRGATRAVLRAAGLQGPDSLLSDREPVAWQSLQVLEAERTIDPLLLELNARGHLNGHTPFSAMLAFVSVLAARLTGDRYVVLSNESSASEATIPGTNINHQYSKSLEFESDFRQYARRRFGKIPEYFSMLRPLNELQISALFSRMPAYHGGFRSCNAGSKTDSWCRSCAKCLFTWIMLSPFIETDRLTGIFGGDLYVDGELAGLLEQLTGVSDVKPFDCVGTVREVNAALDFVIRRMDGKGKVLPVLLQHHRKGRAIQGQDSHSFEKLMKQQESDHHIPAAFRQVLERAMQRLQGIQTGHGPDAQASRGPDTKTGRGRNFRPEGNE